MTTKNYRPLGPDEVIQEGDEAKPKLNLPDKYFRPVRPYCVGLFVKLFPDLIFRRPIPEPTSEGKGEWSVGGNSDTANFKTGLYRNGIFVGQVWKNQSGAHAEVIASRIVGLLNNDDANRQTISTLQSQLKAVEKERDEAESALMRHGYRKSCDIPACNCGDRWNHGGHASERLKEISDEVWQNGVTTLNSVIALRQRAEAAEAELEKAKKLSEGMMASIGPCGACAEHLICGSHSIAHIPSCVHSERDTLRAENERLREALTELVTEVSKRAPKEGAWENTCYLCGGTTECGSVPHRTGCPVMIAAHIIATALAETQNQKEKE